MCTLELNKPISFGRNRKNKNRFYILLVIVLFNCLTVRSPKFRTRQCRYAVLPNGTVRLVSVVLSNSGSVSFWNSSTLEYHNCCHSALPLPGCPFLLFGLNISRFSGKLTSTITTFFAYFRLFLRL